MAVDLAPFVAIDFETSGYEGQSACAVGMVRIEGGRMAGTFASLIRPPSSRVYFTHIHGLTWDMLKDAPAFAELWPQMAAFCEGAAGFVAHNAPFDRGVLDACCAHFGCSRPKIPFYCTLKGARRWLHLPSCSLDNLARHFAIPLDHHRALSDATACAAIFLRLQEMGNPVDGMRLGPTRGGVGKPKRPRTGRLPI